jgi:hypothetical protein
LTTHCPDTVSRTETIAMTLTAINEDDDDCRMLPRQTPAPLPLLKMPRPDTISRTEMIAMTLTAINEDDDDCRMLPRQTPAPLPPLKTPRPDTVSRTETSIMITTMTNDEDEENVFQESPRQAPAKPPPLKTTRTDLRKRKRSSSNGRSASSPSKKGCIPATTAPDLLLATPRLLLHVLPLDSTVNVMTTNPVSSVMPVADFVVPLLNFPQARTLWDSNGPEEENSIPLSDR